MKPCHALILATALTLAVTPALAQDRAPETPPATATPDVGEMAKRLRGFITDEEMALLYDYMSDSAIAALRGGDVAPLPPELEFKLAILRERMSKEGNAAMQGFMQFLHRELDQMLKKFQLPSLPLEPPPTPALPDRG
jgi:hypothetical protein